jgi:hypothetical protein
MKAALLVLLSACEGLTTPPQPAVSVLKRAPEGCFALATPDAPVADALHLYGLCSYQADATLMAGVDEVVVVVDYGPDVEFDATTDVPAPVVTVTIDGAAVNVPVMIGEVQRVGSRAYFEATLRAPTQISSDVRFTAGVNAGFTATVNQPFETLAPPIGLSIAQCPSATSCSLEADVGNLDLVVSIPGDLPQQVLVRSAFNGIEQPDPIDATILPPRTTVAIPVPALAPGTTWTLTAQLAGGTAPSVSAVLTQPGIEAELSCEPNCSLARGDSVGLQITAPPGIHATQALVSTSLNGVPQLVAEPVALVPGMIALTVPGPGTWTIDVSVAGYAAPAIVQTIP